MTPRLRSILIGSMLGDGSLRRVGEGTARFIEHHCVAQRGYLDWKVREFGDYVSNVGPSDKGQHLGFRMSTISSSAFYPFWVRFYPTGKGAKTFEALDPYDVDSLALAVWYMDDGSKTESFVRFSVGKGVENNQLRLDILRGLGMEAAVYGEGTRDVSIHLTNRTSLTRFLELVSPHIPLEMAHKLEFKRPRALGPAPRHIASEDRLKPFIALGWGANRIAKELKVSIGVVQRAMDRFGFQRPTRGRPKNL